MNRALYRLSLACLAMFVLLLINVNYVQAFQAGSLAGRPGNARAFAQQFQFQRGSIIASGAPDSVRRDPGVREAYLGDQDAQESAA